MEFFHSTATRQLSQMFMAIFFFHMSEYLLATAIHGRRNVTLQSLLISKHYIIAMIFSVLEYLGEYAFFPGLKEHWWLSYLGLAFVLMGEVIRKMAVLTAGRAFTHLIRTHREEQQAGNPWNLQFCPTSGLFWVSNLVSWNSNFASEPYINSCICFGSLAIFCWANTLRRELLKAVFWNRVR